MVRMIGFGNRARTVEERRASHKHRHEKSSVTPKVLTPKVERKPTTSARNAPSPRQARPQASAPPQASRRSFSIFKLAFLLIGLYLLRNGVMTESTPMIIFSLIWVFLVVKGMLRRT